ncbi:MAG: hypothetical protein AAGA43_13335 [Bacteroidota bacterium]
MSRLLVLFFFSFVFGHAQVPDSLRTLSSKEIYQIAVDKWKGGDDLDQRILKAISDKADDDISKLRYYHMRGLQETDSLSNLFADSLIDVSQRIDDDRFLASGYFLKGRNFYRSRNYKESLDNFILTSNILERNRDSIALNRLVKENIGLIRLLIGENKEAILMYEELLEDYQDKKSDNYTYTLFNIAVAHHQDADYKKSQEYVKRGLKIANEINSEGYKYLLSVYAANQYAFGNYQTAIDSLKTCIPFFKEIGDYTNESISYYYLGMSYKEMGNVAMSKKHLNRVDSIFQITTDIYPLTRPSWETLIDFSRDEGDSQAELYYIKSLLKVDSVIVDNYKYVNSNLTAKYDVPQLLKDKERLIYRLESRNTLYVIIFGIVVLVALFSFIIYKKVENKKIQNYKRIIAELDAKKGQAKTSSKQQKIKPSLSEEKLRLVGNGLAKLEEENFFTNPKATKATIAKSIGTNDGYVRRYIKEVLGKDVPEYFKEKRVMYIMNRIREDKDYRKFTLSAMAKEAGFGDSQYMNKAFMELQGFKPTFFLKQVEKEINGNS